jgi:hypothetical protein
VPRDDEEIDAAWGNSDEEDRKTVVPPDTKKIPDAKNVAEPEPPTKPKRGTPPVLRLDSASQFERPDPSAVISRRGRAALLDLADSNDELSAVPEPSEALDMVAREADREPVPTSSTAPVVPTPPKSSGRYVDPVIDMRERFSLGDYSGALVVAESILEEDPNDAEALKCSESCRRVLEQMYTTRIGSLERVPFIAVPQEQLRWLNIDHRAGFVLSHVDGNCSLEQILEVSGMPTLDTLRILYELVQQRVIGFR